MKLSEEKIKQLKEEIISMVDGDNNHLNYLSAQYSDWIEVVLSEESITIDPEFDAFEVDGIIPWLEVFQGEDDEWVSVWGDYHTFEEKDIVCEGNKFFLKDVPARFLFNIHEKFDCFIFEEIEAEAV